MAAPHLWPILQTICNRKSYTQFAIWDSRDVNNDRKGLDNTAHIGPGFESSHRQFLSGSFIFYLLGTKDKNKEIEKEKETVGALFKIRNCNLPFRTLRFKPCGSYVTRRQILLVTIQYNLHLCLALKLKWFFSCFVTFKTACSWPLFIYFASFSYTQHKTRSELEPYELRANS